MWYRSLLVVGVIAVATGAACGTNAGRGVVDPGSDEDDTPTAVTPSDVLDDEPTCAGRTVLVCDVEGRAAAGRLIQAEPLDTVSCRVFREGGDGVEFVVAKRPDGSTSQPQHRLDGGVEFFLDLAGSYTLRADPVGGDGKPVCDTSVVVVEARPSSAIHVQLVWHNPLDSDETDTCLSCGADVDLHLARADAEWFDEQLDCHYRNRTPDWGASGPAHDPTLDIDDVNGAGPENINLREPENTTYRVGVHYFDSHGFMTAWATVRIFIRGELVWEGVQRPLDDRDFWDVATISWPDGVVETIDSVTSPGAQD